MVWFLVRFVFWLGLVPLFNDISNFVGFFFNAKTRTVVVLSNPQLEVGIRRGAGFSQDY